MNGDELKDPGRSQARQALGRSRGGLTTKVHLAVDGRGLPLSIVLTPGNANDATAFGQVLDRIRTPRLGTGRPRTTPDRALGDKAYSSSAIRHLLRRRGIAATIPERRDQAANRHRRGALGGRPPAFDKVTYRDRNVAERCFARLKQFRAIATRLDKLGDRYRALGGADLQHAGRSADPARRRHVTRMPPRPLRLPHVERTPPAPTSHMEEASTPVPDWHCVREDGSRED